MFVERGGPNYILCSPEKVFCFEIDIVLSTIKVNLYSTLPNQKYSTLAFFGHKFTLILTVNE